MPWPQQQNAPDSNLPQNPQTVQSTMHSYQPQPMHTSLPTVDKVTMFKNVNTQWSGYNHSIEQTNQVSDATSFVQPSNLTTNNTVIWQGGSGLPAVNYFGNQESVENNLQHTSFLQPSTYQQSIPSLSQPQGQNCTNSISADDNFVNSDQSNKNLLFKADQFNNGNEQSKNEWDDWNDWNDNNLSTRPDTLPKQNLNSLEESFKSESNDNWQYGLTASNALAKVCSELPSKAVGLNLNPNTLTNLTGQALKTEPSSLVTNTNKDQSGEINIRKTTSDVLTLMDTSCLPDTISSENMSIDGVLQSKPVVNNSREFTNSVTAEKIAQSILQHQFMPPPTSNILQNGGNPFKQTSSSKQYLTLGKTKVNQQQNFMPFFASPPPPPDDFANPSTESQEMLPIDNLEFAGQQNTIQNNDLIPNKDRNQYLKTSHLSEERFNRNYETVRGQELINEVDKFPPPGLSRLVLGQPESTQHPPHGLDRLIPGTELDSDLNLVRQADGQDTAPKLRAVFTNVGSVDDCNNIALSNIDFTADRNLYLVPGDSGANEPPQQRVVTGLENHSLGPTSLAIPSQTAMDSTVQAEQREVVLDGENLEDEPNTVGLQVQQQQRQQNHHQQQEEHQQHQEQQHKLHKSVNLPHHQQIHQPDNIELMMSSREEPIEGGNTTDCPSIVKQSPNVPNESALSMGSNKLKDFSNASTENDDSDQNQFNRHSNYLLKTNRLDEEDKKRLTSINNEQRREQRYNSEDSDLSSEKEDRRYRENSTKRDLYKERESKVRNRSDNLNDKVEGDLKSKDRYRSEKDRNDKHSDYRSVRHEKYEKGRSSRYSSNSKYDADLKYETEGSLKNERRVRSDRKRDGQSDRYNEHRQDSEKDRRYRKERREEHDGHDERERQRDRDRDRGNRRGYRDRDRDYQDDREIRRSVRHKKHSDYEDTYRKTSSRNARESDFERDRKDARFSSQAYGGYQTNSYGYDPYTLYQHQQYYEHLRRTNPQAYAEWYRKYYSQMQQDSMGAGGRESVHSGRSSANNDKNRYSVQQHHHQYISHHIPQSNISMTLNSTMIDQQQFVSSGVVSGTYGLSHGQSTGNLSQIGQIQGGYYGGMSGKPYYARSEYSETRTDMSLNLIDGSVIGTTSIQEAARLTPCKFNNPHAIVSLSSGLLVCVKPQYSINETTNVVKLLKLAPNDSTRRLFQSFPGPLVRGLTHKKTAIEFCEEQIKLGPFLNAIRSRQNSLNSLCSSVSQMTKASYSLMWNLLILLLRQNGVVVGTDIAELLMKNKSAYPYEASMSVISSNSAGSRRESLQSDECIEKATGGSDLDFETMQPLDLNKINKSKLEIQENLILNEEQITEKFRNYLLYGNVNEALEWATDNNLWGHALFLASKVDRRSHANVMMKFANKLSLNDPLQTLYQLMSGRTPSSVTSVQDDKWGDWRPHLAMILSNTSQKPELDRKSITTLGDSLYNRGDVFGAHFCYLMAQVGFGKYSNGSQETTSWLANSPNAVRLVLLGSAHQKSFGEFATNEAIMMTEIYEYACSLNDDKFSLNSFQPYKYLLATRMLDYGNHLRCLMYMEQISMHIQRDPTKYELSFIEKVYKLSDRLKYYEPVLDKNVEDQETFENSTTVPDQKWLQNLYEIVKEQKETSDVYLSQEITSQHGLMTDHTLNSEINNQFSEINRQFNELNLQYTNFNPSQSTGILPPSLSEIPTENQCIGTPSTLSQGVQMTQVGQSYNSENYYHPNSVTNQLQQQITGTPSESFVNNNLMQPAYEEQNRMNQFGNSRQEVLKEQIYEYIGDDQQWQQPMSLNNEPKDKNNTEKSVQMKIYDSDTSKHVNPNKINKNLVESSKIKKHQSKSNLLSQTILNSQTVASSSLLPNKNKVLKDQPKTNIIDTKTIAAKPDSSNFLNKDVSRQISSKITQPRKHNCEAKNLLQIQTNQNCMLNVSENSPLSLNNRHLVKNISSSSDGTENYYNYVIDKVDNKTAIGKHVNFDLSSSTMCELNKSTHQNINSTKAKVEKYNHRSIIFNGTFPVDCPIQSRFVSLGSNASFYDPEAQVIYDSKKNRNNCCYDDEFELDAENDDGIDSEGDENDDMEDEDSYTEDEERYGTNNHHLMLLKDESNPSSSWTMQELISNPSIPFNYKKICMGVKESFKENLDKISNNKREMRTYNIDGPIEVYKKKIV